MMKESLTRQKLILKFYSKNIRLNPKNSKNMLSEECQALLFFLFFFVTFNIITSYIFPENFIEFHQVS